MLSSLNEFGWIEVSLVKILVLCASFLSSSVACEFSNLCQFSKMLYQQWLCMTWLLLEESTVLSTARKMYS